MPAMDVVNSPPNKHQHEDDVPNRKYVDESSKPDDEYFVRRSHSASDVISRPNFEAKPDDLQDRSNPRLTASIEASSKNIDALDRRGAPPSWTRVNDSFVSERNCSSHSPTGQRSEVNKTNGSRSPQMNCSSTANEDAAARLPTQISDHVDSSTTKSAAVPDNGDYTPFSGGEAFGRNFRFLDTFADRSKAHRFNTISPVLTTESNRNRKPKSSTRWTAEPWMTSNEMESSNRLNVKQEAEIAAVASAAATSVSVGQPDFQSSWFNSGDADVDPMSALLRRYGASGELLSKASFSASAARGPASFPSSSSRGAGLSPSRQLKQQSQFTVGQSTMVLPVTSHHMGLTSELRPGWDVVDQRAAPESVHQHQQHPLDAGEDSGSGNNNNVSGDVEGESTFSGSGSGIGEFKTPSRDRDDVTDDGGEKNYYCHMCSYVGTSHSEYVSHTSNHFRHRCHLCDYMSTTAGRLKRHLQECHVTAAKNGTGSAADVAEQVVSTTTVTSSVAAATSTSTPVESRKKKCRKCEFQTSDQDEFYEHARTHIRPDRIIECPMCRFATQYRHHLELHLRNHLGSKPHQCPNCDYCCPVASMLASHMKSHSRVNRYRCAECNFSTKFSNALKRHLLAKDHEYGIILNDDGSLPPDGPQRFYPNSASARRRRGGAAGAVVSNRNRKSSPLSAHLSSDAAAAADVRSSELVDSSPLRSSPQLPVSQRMRISPMMGRSAALETEMMSSMTSQEAVRQSVIVKMEGRRDEPERNARMMQIETSPEVEIFRRRDDRMNMNVESMTTPRQQYPGTGNPSMASSPFTVDRMRCLVCGYPANGIADITHHLMTSHGLTSGLGDAGGRDDESWHESPVKRRRPDVAADGGLFSRRGYGNDIDDRQAFALRRAAVGVPDLPLPTRRTVEERPSPEFTQHLLQQRQRHKIASMWSELYGKGISPVDTSFPFVDKLELRSPLSRPNLTDNFTPISYNRQQQQQQQRCNAAVETRRSPYDCRLATPTYESLSLSNTTPRPMHETRAADSGPTPLDLSSKPNKTGSGGLSVGASDLNNRSQLPVDGQTPNALQRELSQLHDSLAMMDRMSSSASPVTKKSRRKGRAFKLDPSQLVSDPVDDDVTSTRLVMTTTQNRDVIGPTRSPSASRQQSPQVDRRQSSPDFSVTNGGADNGGSQRMNPPKKNPALRTVSVGVNAAQGGDGETPAVVKTTAKQSDSTTAEDDGRKTMTSPSSEHQATGSERGLVSELSECQYCGLGFRDRTLYSMHMEFHDRRPGSDPFRCNLCGQQTTDQLEFFVHIARAPHLTSKMPSLSNTPPVGSVSATLGRLVSAIS